MITRGSATLPTPACPSLECQKRFYEKKKPKQENKPVQSPSAQQPCNFKIVLHRLLHETPQTNNNYDHASPRVVQFGLTTAISLKFPIVSALFNRGIVFVLSE
jgi:hypothetical protein